MIMTGFVNWMNSHSLANNWDAMCYAIKFGHVEAIRMLQKAPDSKHKRCSPPRVGLRSAGTGTYNYRSLG